MLPGVYGFEWDAGHIIFLGAFYTAVTLVLVTVWRALMRSRGDLRGGKDAAIRWSEDFHDLPARSRKCRHELTGEVACRECPNGFDCRECGDHGKFGAVEPASAPVVEVLGLSIPLDRRYHRGHTWVHAEPDGTFTIGLDPLASKLAGSNAVPELPAPGTELRVNGPGWRMRCGDDSVRVLSPVNGTVVETNTGGDWTLRVRPGSDTRTTHLLHGREVDAWIRKEVERLELAVNGALADGGVLVEDPSLDQGRAEMFLDA